MRSKKIFLFLILLIIPFAFLFAGCDENVKYHINFIVDEERFQNYLKNYFSYESLNSLIFNLGMKNN